MVFHCFTLHFPINIGHGRFSHMFVCHLYIFLGELYVKVFVLSSHQVVDFFLIADFYYFSLHIVDSNSL